MRDSLIKLMPWMGGKGQLTIEVIFVKGTASARTGDSSDLPLWSTLLLASTLTLAGAVHYKRKRAR